MGDRVKGMAIVNKRIIDAVGVTDVEEQTLLPLGGKNEVNRGRAFANA